MAVITVTPPGTGLSGKTYGYHAASGLLVMKVPTWRDIIACRGLLFETAEGWEFWIGRAFADLLKRIETRLGRAVNALDDFATAPEILTRTRFVMNFVQIAGTTSGAQYLADTGSNVATYTYSAMYAVPHRAIAGYGCSRYTGLTGEYGPEIKYNTSYNGGSPYSDQIYWGAGAVGSSGYTTLNTIGWVLGAVAASMTYAQVIDKIILEMEDQDGIREKVRAGVTAFLSTRGINPSSKMALPVFALSNGKMAFDFGFNSRYLEPYSGRPGSNLGGTSPDKMLPWLAGRLKYGADHYRTSPLLDCTQMESTGGSTLKVYANYSGNGKTLGQVTIDSKSKINDMESRGLLGHQPFTNFYNIDGSGAYTAKVLDEATVSDADFLDWVKFGYDSDGTLASTEGQTELQIQTAANAYLSTYSTSGGREKHVGFTVADTWLMTPRQLARLCWDPISIESEHGTWSTAKAIKVIETPEITGA
jgi:hypothetical protein